MRPCAGYFTKFCPKEELNSLDVRKAYTSCMEKITQIPVFGYFDYYKKYDGHEIEDYTMYVVRVYSTNNETTTLFPTMALN